MKFVNFMQGLAKISPEVPTGLTPGQAATVSTAAAEKLKRVQRQPELGIFIEYAFKRMTRPSNIVQQREKHHHKVVEGQDALIAKHSLNITTTTIAEVPVAIIEPSDFIDPQKGKIILNIHGGLFCRGSARNLAGLIIAADWRARIHSIEYALAPEHRYPVARDQCLAVYRSMSKSHGSENIVVVGTEAGAQLALSMLLEAHGQGIGMPEGLFLTSPFIELSGAIGDSLQDNRGFLHPYAAWQVVRQNYQPPANHDEILKPGEVSLDEPSGFLSVFRGSGKRAKSIDMDTFDAKDPMYSPVHATYDVSFPPTVIVTGTRDCMLSSSIRLYWSLKEAGVRVDLQVSEAMWTNFIWEEELPEAVKARRAVKNFLDSLRHSSNT